MFYPLGNPAMHKESKLESGKRLTICQVSLPAGRVSLPAGRVFLPAGTIDKVQPPVIK